MTSSQPARIDSRTNAWWKNVRRLAQDNTAYRKQGRVWLEGDHLCRAALARGVTPMMGLFSDSYWLEAGAEWSQAGVRTMLVTDALFESLSALESPAGMGFVLALPEAPALVAAAPTVILDRLQDAGNVGSILRSAAAFGFTQIASLQGTVALWSPKVVRAGMGAHFGLRLVEAASPADLAVLGVPVLSTSSHDGELLQHAVLPWPCAWVLGHEGQGVSLALEALSARRIRIGQPGGEESLNVAAAAAICLHASAAGR